MRQRDFELKVAADLRARRRAAVALAALFASGASSPRRPSRRSRGLAGGLPDDDDAVRGELVNAGVAFLDGAAGAGGVAAPLAVLERAREGSDVVRDAAKGAARKVFEGLSAHGVKLAFPLRDAAKAALDDVASVARNPEVKALKRELIEALPLLEAAAVGDAHPDVRSAAARALAQIVGALGEVQAAVEVWKTVVPNRAAKGDSTSLQRAQHAARDILPVLVAAGRDAHAGGRRRRRAARPAAPRPPADASSDDDDSGDEDLDEGDDADAEKQRREQRFRRPPGAATSASSPVIEDALCGSSRSTPRVQAHAALAFHALYGQAGRDAVDAMLPGLLRRSTTI
ncbi:protein kinase regulator [Aureococcus anophagefferens]|nr:protein kinase regulator [Aureococcus anophagefferens]